MKYLKLDSQGRCVAGELDSGVGYVGQFAGHYPITVNQNASGSITHLRSNIVKPNIVQVVSLYPEFVLRPQVEGFYFVHHQRLDYIYTASLMSYTVTLRPQGNTSQGIDDEIQDASIVVTGGVHDICKTSIGFNIYCNGSTDLIQLKLSHTHSGSREFGKPSAANSICHTSLFFAGEYQIHGVIP